MSLKWKSNQTEQPVPDKTYALRKAYASKNIVVHSDNKGQPKLSLKVSNMDSKQ